MRYKVLLPVVTGVAFLGPLLCHVPALGQAPKDLHQSISFGAVENRYVGNEQYLGFGGEYAYRFRDWLGVSARVSFFPTTQVEYSAQAGGTMRQEAIALQSGRKFGPVRIYALFGIGVTSIYVFKGQDASFTLLYETRNLSSYDVGGVAEIAVNRRWSVQFSPFDHHVSYGTYNQIEGGQTAVASAASAHTFQLSSAITFHF